MVPWPDLSHVRSITTGTYQRDMIVLESKIFEDIEFMFST